MYAIFCVNLFSNILHIYLGMKLLGHTVTLFNHLKNCKIIFQQGCCSIFHSHHQSIGALISPHICWHWCLYNLLILSTLVGIKWSYILVLFFTFFIISDVSIFSCAHWSFEFSLETCLFRGLPFLKLDLIKLSFYF